MTTLLLCWLLYAITLRQPALSETPSDAPKVCGSRLGCVHGTFMPGFQTDYFEAFLGIPYALPPVGELRFNNPRVYPRLFGIYNATTVKSDCMQKNYLLKDPVVYGKEDCLYLNIYRPAGLSKKQKLPVIVFIHGGGWFSGSPSPNFYGPEYFMDTQQVVLVTLAYRLGPLGFLSTGDAFMSGNWGLKDQRLALRWVQRNIAAFAGNPRLVTLFGQSVGSVAAHLHMLSSSSAGLFHNVIALSGTANAPFALTENPLPQTRQVAAYCNISNAPELSTWQLARALRRVDAATVVNASSILKNWHFLPLTNFRPVVESSSVYDAFLTQNPLYLMRKSKYKAVPWLVSFVPQEGGVAVLSILENAELSSEFNQQFDKLLEELLEWPPGLSSAQIKHNMALIFKHYFSDQHLLNDATAAGFVDVMTDRGFHYPLYNLLRDHVRRSDAEGLNPLYLFKFNYRGPYSWATEFSWGQPSRNYGVIHADDLIYLFREPALFPSFNRNSTEAEVVKAAVANMVYFAKNSKPQTPEMWPACSQLPRSNETDVICDYQELLNVNASFGIRNNNKFNIERMKLWEELLQD